MKFDDELVINGRKYYRRSDWKDSKVPRGVLEHDCILMLQSSQISHPRRPRGSQSGRKRRDESLQVRAKEPLGTDSHQTISELFFGHKKCFVLLCPISEQFLLSSFREFVHDSYYLATVAWFVHQAFLTTNKGTTDESKNVSDAIMSNSICTGKILFVTYCNVS